MPLVDLDHGGKTQHPARRQQMHRNASMLEHHGGGAGFAKAIGVPLVAHLTIHWSLTDIGDDPNGALFAKVREGLNKWLHRRGIAFAAVWSRERQSGGQSDVVHSHLLSTCR